MKINLFLITLSLNLAVSCGPGQQEQSKNLSPAEFKKQLETGQGVLIDVRTAEEFQAGHLSGALNIDVKAPDFEQRVDSLEKKGTYFLYCRSGKRSETAKNIMTGLGFSKYYTLDGGIEAWKKDGLPVITK